MRGSTHLVNAFLVMGIVASSNRAVAQEAAVASSVASSVPSSVTAPSATTEQKPVRWHGSALSFDQSATTQTVGLGADYQSYNPTYEWWVAFRPRYFLYETKTDAVSLNLWANLYLELTNSDTTTRRREALVGPTYVWATYGHTFIERDGYKTAVTVGPRLTIPTDKAARASGQIIGVGGTAGVSQGFPLRGKGARALSGARLGLSAIFNHPFSQATTAVNDDLRLLRQNVEARLIPSDQLTGGLLVENSLNLVFTGQLELLPRLDLSLSYVLLNAWGYSPPEGECVATYTGCAPPISITDPQTYKVNTWATASLNYQVVDDLTISVGYYNLARQIGDDGMRRNPLWSPSARVFFSLTGTLDVTYGRLTGTRRAID